MRHTNWTRVDSRSQDVFVFVRHALVNVQLAGFCFLRHRAFGKRSLFTRNLIQALVQFLGFALTELLIYAWFAFAKFSFRNAHRCLRRLLPRAVFVDRLTFWRFDRELFFLLPSL